VNRERIELSPRFVGIVKWIGVKKGDPVAKDQIVVTLDDAEQAARVAEADGAVAAAAARVEKSELDLRRAEQLRGVDSDKIIDDARIERAAARAALRQAEGQLALARAYLDWTVIRSPIDGVVLEKLVEPGELVSPQSFGGPRGPSTAFLALADPADLQVEIDVSEAELAKIRAGQPCRVSPEAYPDRRYRGRVAEIAPEANRAKGTLQVKVQIENPDPFLVPEFTARVDFLAP
jgi:RND family efflux transporter MFP subunit